MCKRSDSAYWLMRAQQVRSEAEKHRTACYNSGKWPDQKLLKRLDALNRDYTRQAVRALRLGKAAA